MSEPDNKLLPPAWNRSAGQSWVELQPLLDHLFLPFERMLVEAAATRPRDGVLDVGCGTGATTLAVAKQLGAGGHCVGVDISEPMIAAARARAARDALPATFICADAQEHALAPASFDLIMSRFGVMFFDDPVLAFSQLRRAARVGADLKLIVWRGPDENPFMTAAEHAAAPLLPIAEPREAGAPGQFGFAEPARVRGILQGSAWSDVDITAIDVDCSFPESQLIDYLSRLGPVGRALPGIAEPLRGKIIATVRAAFEPYVHGTEVRFNAACWMVSARAR